MLQISTHLIGLAGAAVIVTTLAPGDLASSVLAPGALRTEPARAAPGPEVRKAQKSDRLATVAGAQSRVAVVTIELVGTSRASVVLRDQGGRVLYKSDPASGTTVVAKDVDLPVVTLKERDREPVVEPPAQRQSNEPPSPKARNTNPAGCEGAVSSLVRSDHRVPGLCLAALPNGKAS
jgi:hypothetical protein